MHEQEEEKVCRKRKKSGGEGERERERESVCPSLSSSTMQHSCVPLMISMTPSNGVLPSNMVMLKHSLSCSTKLSSMISISKHNSPAAESASVASTVLLKSTKSSPTCATVSVYVQGEG